LQDVDVVVEGEKQNGYSMSTMGGMDSIDLAEDRALVKAVINLRVP